MLEVQTHWDGQFVPFPHGLQLPDVGNYKDPTEIQLAVDANVLFETMKKADKAFKAALRSSDPAIREPALAIQREQQNQIAGLVGKMDLIRESLGQFESTHAMVKQRYLDADRIHFSRLPNKPISDYTQMDMDQWVLQRLQGSSGFLIGEDADLTLTQNANHLSSIPLSVQAENYMAHNEHGRDTFPLAFVRYWREAMQVKGDNFYLLGSRVPLRPGVDQFYQWTRTKKIQHTIISANFRPFIKGITDRLPYPHIISTHAVEVDDISATDKKTVIQLEALSNPERAFIMAEDGDSGLPALEPEASEITAFYLVLEGSKVHQAVRKAQLPHYTFKDFYDNIATLQRLYGLAKTQ